MKLFKFGAKIFDKIETAMVPPAGFEEEPIVPYDLWEGANFKLRCKKGDGGWPTYQDSTFESAGPLFKKKNGDADEAALEAVYAQVQSLKPFIDPEGVDADGEKYFKSYSELKAKLYSVLDMYDSENSDLPHTSSAIKNKVTTVKDYDTDEDDASDTVVDEDEDDSLALFASLVDED